MKEKIKYIIIFITGIIISTVISVYAATVISAGEVSYTSNSNTTVQTGLDNLYTKANSTANSLSAIKTLYSYSGAIFITKSSSVNNTVLNAAFGGTWTKVSTGRVLLGAGSNGTTNYTAGSTGGSETHQHKYGFTYGSFYGSMAIEADGNSGLFNYSNASSYSLVNGNLSATTSAVNVNNGAAGASTSRNIGHRRTEANTSTSSNMPPYYVIYVWQRS